MSRCMACNARFTDEELLIADDLCKKCLGSTYESSMFSSSTDDYYGDQEDER